MKLGPNENKRTFFSRTGTQTVIRDTYVNQSSAPVEEVKKEEPKIEIKMSGEPSLQPIIDKIKEETNEPIQSEQVVKERTPQSSKSVRKSSRSRSKSNG